MTALYIILGVLLILFLICLIRVRVFLLYSEDVRLTLQVLFYKKVLLPSAEKAKEKHKKPKEKTGKKPKAEEKKPKEEKKKKPSYLSKLKEKKGVTGLISLFTELAKIAASTLKGLFKHIVIKRLNVGIAFNGGDAASTAVKYAQLCAAFYPAVNIITSITVCKDYNVTLEPIFDDERETEASADIYAYIRVGWVLKEAAKAGVRLLIARLKL